MALVATAVAGYNRSDIAVFACTFLDADVTGTLTNGTDFTFRNTSGVAVAPVAVLITMDTVGAATTPVYGVQNAANVVLTKVAGAGTAAPFHVILLGAKSKAVG
jgi:hypothetical protein